MGYRNAFIAVAEDCPSVVGTVPQPRAGRATVATIEYELIAGRPYRLTQEEVQFAVHLRREGLDPGGDTARRTVLWSVFFARPRACMRASPLVKTHGWGLHFDAHGRVALVAVEEARYRALSEDPGTAQLRALRNGRA